MKTTIQTLLKSVFDDEQAKKLSKQISTLYNSNRQQLSYDDILDIIQDTILFNLSNNHQIEPALFTWKFRNLLLNHLRDTKKMTRFHLLKENELSTETMNNTEAYNDKESRYNALVILDKEYPNCNCEESYAQSYWDIKCNAFYIDVKRLYHNLNDYPYAGINKESYDNYIKLNKPVLILFIFNDAYIIMDIKNKYREWSGYIKDNAKGEIYRTMYNFPINKAIKTEYYE